MSPLTDERRNWFDWRFGWLRREFGDELLYRPTILPLVDFFPDPYIANRQSVETLFRRICNYMQIDRSRINLIFYENASVTKPEVINTNSAAGLFTQDYTGQITICLEESELDNVQNVVATLAHELAHVHLIADGHLKSRTPDHEHLTDLLTIYFGFGVFTAGWEWRNSQSRVGYLQKYESAYAMALYAWLRNERTPPWTKYLRPDVRGDFKVELNNLTSGRRTVTFEEHQVDWNITTETQLGMAIPGLGTTDEFDDFYDRDAAENENELEELNIPNDEFTIGWKHLESGNYEEAIKLFTHAISTDPEDYEALLTRARTYLIIGEFAKAICDASQCIEVNPKNISAIICRGVAKLELFRYAEAIDDLNTALKSCNHPEALFYRALAHFGLGGFSKAIRDLSVATDESPKDAKIYLARSRAYEAIGELSRAKIDLDKSIRLNADYEDPNYRAACLIGRITPIS